MEFGRKSPTKQPLPWFLRLIICICLGFLAAVVFLYSRQHSMIYHPRSYEENYTKDLPRDGVELQFATAAGNQVAFYLPRGNSARLPKRLWVAFGGNASLALEWTWFIGQDRQPGDAFLLIDYPGYGKSEGYATVATTRGAADGALKELAARLLVNDEQIESRLNVMGHSLGSAVALDFATHHPVQRIVLISTFTSLRDEATTLVGGMLSHLLVENYDNRAALSELGKKSPPPKIDIFHGTSDDVIPFRMGRALATEFSSLVTLHAVEGADHVNVLQRATAEILGAMNN